MLTVQLLQISPQHRQIS